jgi:hypothetical protein
VIAAEILLRQVHLAALSVQVRNQASTADQPTVPLPSNQLFMVQ